MLQHGWIWKHLLNKFTVSEIQDTLQAVKHSPLSILVGLKHRPGGFATHPFKIQHQHIVDLKVHAHTGSSIEESWVARKAEGEFSFSHLWTFHVLNSERYLLRINRGFQRRHTDGQWSHEKMLTYSVTSSSIIPWIVAREALLFMGVFRWEYWGGLPFPSPWYLPDPEIEPVSPVSLTLQVYSLSAEPLLFYFALF